MEKMDKQMNCFDQMNTLFNKYQDYADLIQSDNNIIFQTGFDKMTVYDVLKKEAKHHKIEPRFS